jgi:hypothetical protein
MKKSALRTAYVIAASWLLLGVTVRPKAARIQNGKAPAVPGPMLKQGLLSLETPDFTLSLVRSSQTVAALLPKGAEGFDFTPGDLLAQRSRDGYYHLGDLDLRIRNVGSQEWKNYSTAVERAPVAAQPTRQGILASADLTPTLPAAIPLQVVRSWVLEGGRLVLRFTLKNKTAQSVQVGALGIPMIFNNVLNERSLENAHKVCSFYDPYIGEDAGYLQVTRLSGQGPALLVIPDGKTPLEAYSPLLSKEEGGHSASRWPAPIFTDPTPRGVTFEGFYDWMVHSEAFAENEWKNTTQWNPSTLLTLAPGESKEYGVKFLVSDSIRHLEKTLSDNGRPVALGIPGYVLPMDVNARLFVKYGKAVRTAAVEPVGAIEFKSTAAAAGWKSFGLTGKKWGRARLTLTYEDGLVQTIQYLVIKPEANAVADLGRFLTTKQWFVDRNDPFHRSPSVMTYDRETNQIVLQDSRVWIAGLGDEGGAGSWLAAIMKQLGQPNKEELDKYAQFVEGVLWGGLQYKDGPLQYGVRKSLFYYQPGKMTPNYYREDLDWTSWTSWNQQAAEKVDRSYNYPHVAAANWVLYRLARNNQGLVTNHPWDWYLDHAYETAVAMVNFAPAYAAFGQMEGDIFVQILADLKREGMGMQAANLESKMRARADRWRDEHYPFGSEMPWDSTGQEEVYAWMRYFGYSDKADMTLNAILGYDPALPHWGYNGSARRYWDFIFAAKYGRLERQLHHYGSSLNAIPLLAEFRQHPDDFYLLRVGYAGTMGALTNIDQQGFASAAFHAFPDTLKSDPLSGDYGPNFFGYAFNTATYIVQHPDFGWLAFGGNLRFDGNTVKVTPLDAFRTRVFVASAGLWLTLDAGQFDAIEVNSASGAVRVALAAATRFTPTARLRVEQPSKVKAGESYRPIQSLRVERDAYVIPLQGGATWVDLTSKP